MRQTSENSLCIRHKVDQASRLVNVKLVQLLKQLQPIVHSAEQTTGLEVTVERVADHEVEVFGANVGLTHVARPEPQFHAAAEIVTERLLHDRSHLGPAGTQKGMQHQ